MKRKQNVLYSLFNLWGWLKFNSEMGKELLAPAVYMLP